MECNVGGVDRIVRYLVGVILAAITLMFVGPGATRISLLVLSGLALASAWFGICFINKMLGFNTAQKKVS